VCEQARKVVEDAIKVLPMRMAEDIHLKVRDFLRVHNKGGEPCPRCGNATTQAGVNQRIISYCRRCQPGLLIKN
jgi:formamidopyrimidine-DNA glycosylase